MTSTYVGDLANFVVAHGAPVIFLVIALELLGAPLPGETLLIAVGTAAGIRNADILPLFLVAWAGAFLGDNAGYALGRWFGRTAIKKFGSHFGLTDARMDGFEQTFDRYGVFIVASARFIVPLRQLNGLIAGSMHMPWLRFAIANAVGAALWVGLWLVLSSRFSNLIEHLDKIYGVGIAILVAAVLAIVIVVIVRTPAAKACLRTVVFAGTLHRRS